jgi:small subunit ribosomal protein S17
MSDNTNISTLVGTVLSAKMDKTLTVAIQRLVKHHLYKKYIKKTTKLHVHDEGNVAKEGDIVSIKETRPYSKTKSWVLVKIEN